MIKLSNGFYAKISESGTHIHKGFLKVRVDIYSPVGSKTYPLHWVDHYDRKPTEEELANETLLALVPKHKELNPCLCHFITISPDTTKQEIIKNIKEIFDAKTLTQLDSELLKIAGAKGVHQIMLSKHGIGREISSSENNLSIIKSINTRFREV